MSSNWATRIRTLKMTESESVALPFGDSPKVFFLSTVAIIYHTFELCKHFLQKITYFFTRNRSYKKKVKIGKYHFTFSKQSIIIFLNPTKQGGI